MAAFDGEKYLSLETYRKSGKGVRTPVWFAASPEGPEFYIYSTADSGKAKRIRHTSFVRVAPCGVRGDLTGPWIDARATVVTGEEFAQGMRLLNRKYWPWKQLLDLFARVSPGHARIMFAVQPATTSV